METQVAEPMFRLNLFRIRAFTAGNLASLLSALGRGGLMFILIIWLQGIYLPIHGYGFSQTPLWAGIAMIPLTAGFLVAGPLSGWLSDRFGARPFATGGMLVAALAFLLLELLPVNFDYRAFAALLLLIGLAMGLFASPNQMGIMNSLPAHRRGGLVDARLALRARRRDGLRGSHRMGVWVRRSHKGRSRPRRPLDATRHRESFCWKPWTRALTGASRR